MSLVTVRNLRQAFAEHLVLHDVNLEVAEGSVTVLIGPSGSGKTTLLRCLNGLSHPQAGVVTVGDVTIDYSAHPGSDRLAALRAQSGMVFQAHYLFPHRTALQNVTEGPIHAQREPADRARQRGLELLQQVGLADKADAYPGELSGGQQQRVGIARALALRPRLILFDEPTSALDPETVGDVLLVMRDLAKQVADHVAFLDRGVIVEDGPPSQVLSKPVEPRTREFLRRVLDPLSVEQEKGQPG
jgi:cystine transport system ATP-binding protein